MTKTLPKSAAISARNETEPVRGDDNLTDVLDVDKLEIAAGDNLGIAGVLSAIDGLYGEIDKLAMADGRGPLSAVAVEQLCTAGGAAASLLRTDGVARGALWRLLDTDRLAAADARLLLRQVAHGLDRVAAAAGSRRDTETAGSELPEANGGTPDAGPIVTREFELWLAASMG
jgi:hypothetical protein